MMLNVDVTNIAMLVTADSDPMHPEFLQVTGLQKSQGGYSGATYAGNVFSLVETGLEYLPYMPRFERRAEGVPAEHLQVIRDLKNLKSVAAGKNPVAGRGSLVIYNETGDFGSPEDRLMHLYYPFHDRSSKKTLYTGVLINFANCIGQTVAPNTKLHEGFVSDQPEHLIQPIEGLTTFAPPRKRKPRKKKQK